MSIIIRFIFLFMFSLSQVVINKCAWINLRFPLEKGLVSYDLSIILDRTSILGIRLVLFISGCVFLFSSKYIEIDSHESRFTYILALFVLSILLLLIRNSIPFLLMGWDGLGITSFLLILYYDSKTNNRSGIITFRVNRFGDALLVSRLVFFLCYGHMYLGTTVSLMIGVVYILISITKRAQYPFSIWLPLAIDAPTPVSALVHRRTLVTAGLFLLVRIIPEGHNIYICIVGGITICVGGICSIYATDLKKLIANSTLANLGLIIVTLSLRQKSLILFHLCTHAIFKAGLFLVAGAMLTTSFGIQDRRRIYRSLKTSPRLRAYLSSFFLSSLGIFFISTFYSKHQIILLCQCNRMNLLIPILMVCGAALRSLYRLRFAYIMTGDKYMTVINREIPKEIKISIVLLAGGSIVYGNRYRASTLYSLFSFEIPLIILLIIRITLFIIYNNKLNSITFRTILYIEPIIDTINNKALLARLGTIDSGFGRLRARNYQAGLYWLGRELLSNRLNPSFLIRFFIVIVFYIYLPFYWVSWA